MVLSKAAPLSPPFRLVGSLLTHASAGLGHEIIVLICSCASGARYIVVLKDCRVSVFLHIPGFQFFSRSNRICRGLTSQLLRVSLQFARVLDIHSKTYSFSQPRPRSEP